METVQEALQVRNPHFFEYGSEPLSLEKFFDDVPKPVQLGPAIPRLFADAVSPRLKFPHINLRASNGQNAVLRLAGPKSTQPGSVTVTSVGSFHERVFYGRITTTGDLQPRSAMTAEIIALLRRFRDDPIAVAGDCGRVTGNCAFCGLALSDPRSTALGYGPVCARAWKLPWRANRGLLRLTGGLYGYVWTAVSGTEKVPA
jgi:hypothetical protein